MVVTLLVLFLRFVLKNSKIVRIVRKLFFRIHPFIQYETELSSLFSKLLELFFLNKRVSIL